MIGLDGKPIINEELVRQWVRDEQEKIAAEKQAACNHKVSGTVTRSGDVQCDACGKILDIEEDGNIESTGSELRNVGIVR
jgi:hypothetical protein